MCLGVSKSKLETNTVGVDGDDVGVTGPSLPPTLETDANDASESVEDVDVDDCEVDRQGRCDFVGVVEMVIVGMF